jgi:YD repeat-containing protein
MNADIPADPMKSLLIAFALGATLGAHPAAQSDTVDTVFLVPVFAPVERLAELQRYYHDTLNLNVQILPPFQPIRSWDVNRLQWSAEKVIDELIEMEGPRLRSAGRVAIVAITADDLYSRQDNWVFGWWSPSRVSVISYARMDPRRYKQQADDAVIGMRLRRMVTKYIGRLYFDLPVDDEPSSPMYAKIFSVAALDAISDDLAPAGFFSQRPLVEFSQPVNLSTGVYIHQDVDFVLEDTPRVVFERTYRSDDSQMRPFGLGNNHPYGRFLVGDAPALSYVDLVLEDGVRVHYRRASPGTGAENAVFVHDATPSGYLNSRLSWKGTSWLLETTDGSSVRFPACSPGALKACTMSGYTDRNGRRIEVSFDARNNPVRIETDHHHTVELQYDDQDRVIRAWDDAGHWMTYRYDARGRLFRADYSTGYTRQYTYDAAGRMLLFTDGNVTERMAYDSQGRCVRFERTRVTNRSASGEALERREALAFAYTPGETPATVREAVITALDGRRTVTFNAQGYPVVDTYAAGTPGEQQTHFERDASSSVVHRVTVSCSVAGRKATVADEVNLGQSEAAIVARTRRACDVKAVTAQQ